MSLRQIASLPAARWKYRQGRREFVISNCGEMPPLAILSRLHCQLQPPSTGGNEAGDLQLETLKLLGLFCVFIVGITVYQRGLLK